MGTVSGRYALGGDIPGLTGSVICREEGQHRKRLKLSLQSYFVPRPVSICCADCKFAESLEAARTHSIFWERPGTSFPRGLSVLHVCLYVPLRYLWFP